ncbi:glycoside hydrolase family 2 [Myxococcota bacterium]|nr:glycoside hydrolase family 2 [Myxococcota bacterium]
MRSSEDGDGTSSEYPRPQFRRAEWICLDGPWDFTLDPDAKLRAPDEVTFDRVIEVPYAPETTFSGIADGSYFRACWYRRRFEHPDLGARERLLLHFGAVDYHATVWVDGSLAGHHEGGYTPFSIDVTNFLKGPGPHEVVVRAFDDPTDLTQPRGKQDWELEPHSIWYPRTTGIWQTVWLEPVPPTRLEKVRWAANLNRWEISIQSNTIGERRENLRLAVKLRSGTTLLADDTYAVVAGEVHRRIALSDPGIDDSRNDLLWSPTTPTLIEAELELWGERGELVDKVQSYTALRSIGVQGDRILLNGRPYPLRLVLDQGYWEGSGMTAPNDLARKRDVELAKAMGFNGVRKHQKLEEPRYLYWADRLGLVVWAEMPSAYRFTRESVNRVTREWLEAIERDWSHPCIIAWVPFNESWGVPNLPDNPAERHYVQALYHLTKTLDSTRPVVGNDGWESVATDLIGIHDYDSRLERIARRYHAEDVRPRLFRRERPGGRVLMLEHHPQADHPIVLSEFGGIALAPNVTETWGYSRAPSEEELARRYEELLEVVHGLELLSGFCYTQFADTYQEANGLLYADRTPKFPLERMAKATRGHPQLHLLGADQLGDLASTELVEDEHGASAQRAAGPHDEI